ncbi:MAG: hypothetical protein K0S77_2497 [Pseudomonas sp.]|nr:hypothetical protein [Pseudomonas sp.]
MESCTNVLRHQMQSAEPVLMRLDIEMQGIDFDPLIPASVEVAIATVYRVTESLLGPFRGNPILGPLADELRTQYLEGIRARVKEARHLA